MRGGPPLALLFLLACGPGPTTTEPATPPAPSSSITPTRKVRTGPDCATKAMEKLAPQLTACNPTELEGCAYLTTSVETDGRVSGSEVFVSDGLPADVVTCLQGVLKDARFAPIAEAGKMTVPVSFTRTR